MKSGLDMALIPVPKKKPTLHRPGLIGPQVPKTSPLTTATKVLVITAKLQGIQFHSYPIDPKYPESRVKRKVKIAIDWDNL